MKIGFLILLVLFALVGRSADLNVQTFGATGNGVTDDTRAINTALAASHTQSKNLYFPPGTYLCNIIDVNLRVLSFDASGINNVTIYGSGATILTTKDSACTQLYVFANTKSYGFIINGLKFLNTHGKIIGYTSAVFLQGGPGENIDTTLLLNCTFTGFAAPVGGQGIIGWWIQTDSFSAPHGHDDAQQNSQPAVDLWFSDNSNGYCMNVYVQSCIASGYTGPIPLNCKRPMDGFVYGYAYNLRIDHNNRTSNFSEEHIDVQPPTTFPNTTLPIWVENNDIDCTLPPGCVDDNGSPHKINYGIRVDASNVTIINNRIKNYTWGIMMRGIDFPTLTFHDITITRNTLSGATDTATYSIQMGIFMQGSSIPVTNAKVSLNVINTVSAPPIQILAATNPTIYGNLWSPLTININL